MHLAISISANMLILLPLHIEHYSILPFILIQYEIQLYVDSEFILCWTVFYFSEFDMGVVASHLKKKVLRHSCCYTDTGSQHYSTSSGTAMTLDLRCRGLATEFALDLPLNVSVQDTRVVDNGAGNVQDRRAVQIKLLGRYYIRHRGVYISFF